MDKLLWSPVQPRATVMLHPHTPHGLLTLFLSKYD